MGDSLIPEEVRKENARQMSQGATGQPEGFFYKGKVYIVASEMNGVRDIVRVVFHETLGHFGLRGTFGEELKPILKQISVLRRADVEAKAEQYGLDMNVESDRLTAAEEVLAELAQENPQISFVRRTIAAIRAWFRKNVPGFSEMMLTDDEIINSYLIPARDFVRNGQGAAKDGGSSFSRKAQTDTPAFQKWFGKSKIVNRDGAPMLVYHGTDQSFDSFDPKLGGKGTLANDAKGAIFFTTSLEVSEDFAGYVYTSPDGKNVERTSTESNWQTSRNISGPAILGLDAGSIPDSGMEFHLFVICRNTKNLFRHALGNRMKSGHIF